VSRLTRRTRALLVPPCPARSTTSSFFSLPSLFPHKISTFLLFFSFLSDKVVGLRVKEGDRVEKGQALVVLSAMKMETVVAAPISGKIKRLLTAMDEDLAGGDLLLEIEEAA
jgi:multidrug efflux pump subunit AcrA (membrane-fusion protein)